MRRFSAVILADNRPMLELLDDLGRSASPTWSSVRSRWRSTFPPRALQPPFAARCGPRRGVSCRCGPLDEVAPDRGAPGGCQDLGAWTATDPVFGAMIALVAVVVATVILVFFGIGYALGRLFL